MPCLIKICGLSEETTLHAAIDAGADMVGFVHFAKSPRHLSLARAAELKAQLPAHVKSALVLVDPDDALLSEIAATLAPDYLQLHGHESPARVSEIRQQGFKLIKAIPVDTFPPPLRGRVRVGGGAAYSSPETSPPASPPLTQPSPSGGEGLTAAAQYEPLVDMFLFDAKPPTTNRQPPTTLPGGNGIAFDWTLMHSFQSPRPWLLSGGLTPENVGEAIRQSGARGVDVSSGVEREPGVKDAAKIEAFIKAARA